MDQHSKLHFVEGLAATHGSQLVRFFVSRLRDATEAHDLAQEVFLRLLRLERPDLVRQPEAYLFTVAANIVRETALKRSARPLQVTLEDTPNEQLNNADFFTANSPEESAQQQTRILELERTLATLSPKARAALIWHRRDGITYDEIGARLGVSRNMVKKYIAKALAECRKFREET
jgi:RNA polymerase sigma-70 factor (ECF subfamily)